MSRKASAAAAAWADPLGTPRRGRCPLRSPHTWRRVEALTIFTVKAYLGSVDDVRVLADAAAVEVVLDPIRASILDVSTEPGSAATVAAAVGSTRQKVNYHLKALEAHGLVELAEERGVGRGITERFVRRSARHVVVAPDVLQSAAIDPNEVADRLSAAYLIAVNARTVSEVGAIVQRGDWNVSADPDRRHGDRVQIA